MIKLMPYNITQFVVQDTLALAVRLQGRLFKPIRKTLNPPRPNPLNYRHRIR